VAKILLLDSLVRTLPLWLFLPLLPLLASAVPARAQEVGVRAGVSGDPDQFYAGVHFESQPLVDRLRFRPNLEVGVGSDVTLVALNFEFAYPVPLPRTRWRLYVGAGPALNLYRTDRDTNPEGGFNILFGLEHRGGLFTELKVGALDSPSVKFAVGYAFRP
jgi:hypothetical protein